MIQNSIRDLVRYGLATGLVEPEDTIYTMNRLLELFGLEEPEDAETPITADKEEEPPAGGKAGRYFEGYAGLCGGKRTSGK